MQKKGPLFINFYISPLVADKHIWVFLAFMF